MTSASPPPTVSFPIFVVVASVSSFVSGGATLTGESVVVVVVVVVSEPFGGDAEGASSS